MEETIFGDIPSDYSGKPQHAKWSFKGNSNLDYWSTPDEYGEISKIAHWLQIASLCHVLYGRELIYAVCTGIDTQCLWS